MTPIQQEIMRLRRDIDELKKHTRNIPSRWAGGRQDNVFILNNIEGNDNLWTSGAQSIDGIKYDGATSVLTVPNVDASIPSIGTFAVGLGRATLLGTGGKVYVATRPNPGTGVVTGILSDIPDNSVILSVVRVSIPLVSDASILVPVYIGYRF